MDATNLHLLLNHFPILGTLFGLCLLTYGLISKSNALESASLVALIVISLLTIPAFLTGGEAEEAIEHLPGVSELYIEEHEELAEVALWLMIATGALALLTLIISYAKKNTNIVLKLLVVVIAAATFGTMVAVGNHGGKIRHSELRGEAINQSGHDEGQEEGEYEREDDDDDD